MTTNSVQFVTALDLRRKWTEEQKAAIVSETMDPGGTVGAVARKYDLHPRVIYYWRAKLLASNAQYRRGSALSQSPAGTVSPKKRGRPAKDKSAVVETVLPAPRVFQVEGPGTSHEPDSMKLIHGLCSNLIGRSTPYGLHSLRGHCIV